MVEQTKEKRAPCSHCFLRGSPARSPGSTSDLHPVYSVWLLWFGASDYLVTWNCPSRNEAALAGSIWPLTASLPHHLLPFCPLPWCLAIRSDELSRCLQTRPSKPGHIPHQTLDASPAGSSQSRIVFKSPWSRGFVRLHCLAPLLFSPTCTD